MIFNASDTIPKKRRRGERMKREREENVEGKQQEKRRQEKID